MKSEQDLTNALLGLVKARTREKREARTIVPPRTQVLTQLAHIKPTPVRWLWRDRIPLGKLTIIDGDPGQGKSAVCLDLAARISRGSLMPDRTPGVRGHVVIMNAEDDLSDSIVPRLMRAGADLTRIQSIKAIPDSGHERLPSIPEDLDWIATAVRRTRATLLIIDPMFAFMGGVMSWSAMRKSMGPLMELARETGVAILLVRHMTKGQGQSNPLYRGGGSMAIVGSVRSAMFVGKDFEDPAKSYLIHTKSNLAAFPKTLSFTRKPERGVVRVKWGHSIDLTAEQYFERSDTAVALAQLLRESSENEKQRKVRSG